MARKKSDKVAIQVRMKESLRTKIKKAAKGNTVPMNGEINARLGRSFDADDALIQLFGNGRTMALMRTVLFAKELVEGETGKSMHEDFETSVAAKYAMSTILNYSISGKGPEKSAEYVQREHAYAKAIERIESEYEQRTGKKITNWLAAMTGRYEKLVGPFPTDPESEAMKRGEALAKSLFARLSEGVGKDPMAEAALPAGTED